MDSFIVTSQPSSIHDLDIDLSTQDDASGQFNQEEIYYKCVCDSIQTLPFPVKLVPAKNSALDQIQTSLPHTTSAHQSALNQNLVDSVSSTFLVPIGDVPRWYPKSEKERMSTPMCARCYLYKVNSGGSISSGQRVEEDRTRVRFEASGVRCKLYFDFCVDRIVKPAATDSCFYLLLIWIVTCWLPRCI